MNAENWKVHPEYDNILVSDTGVIIRKKHGRWHELNQYDNKRGYLRISLADPRVSQCVHTLVAETFVSNPDPNNKKYINHIDGDKHNNRADNLEWVSSSENQRHAYRTGLKVPNYQQKTMKKIEIVETGEIYRGIGDCARQIGGNPGHIHECLNGGRKTHLGYHFKYVKESCDEQY